MATFKLLLLFHNFWLKYCSLLILACVQLVLMLNVPFVYYLSAQHSLCISTINTFWGLTNFCWPVFRCLLTLPAPQTDIPSSKTTTTSSVRWGLVRGEGYHSCSWSCSCKFGWTRTRELDTLTHAFCTVCIFVELLIVSHMSVMG